MTAIKDHLASKLAGNDKEEYQYQLERLQGLRASRLQRRGRPPGKGKEGK